MTVGHRSPAVVLTVAGSDSGGAAGIQADLKTFAALGCYGASVITAVTAQNTLGVRQVHPIPAAVLAAQLDAVLDDLPVAAVKVGMLADAEQAAVVAARAATGALPNLVLDPVLSASTGHRLGSLAAIELLLAYATVLTPNADEAAALIGCPVSTPEQMADAARRFVGRMVHAPAPAVVVTGGDLGANVAEGDLGGREAVDVVHSADGVTVLRGPRVDTGNDHGTGCTFSSAIAARLASGHGVPDAISSAKQYVRAALSAASGWRLGHGAGPLNHFHAADTPRAADTPEPPTPPRAADVWQTAFDTTDVVVTHSPGERT